MRAGSEALIPSKRRSSTATPLFEKTQLIHGLAEVGVLAIHLAHGKQTGDVILRVYMADTLMAEEDKIKGVLRIPVSGKEAFHIPLATVARGELDELGLIAHLRNALAASAIEQVCPDIVIFDEFQRFRDLLEPHQDAAAQRVIGKLRGDEAPKPPARLSTPRTRPSAPVFSASTICR